MELIGKTAPLPGDLRRSHEDGFDKIELYMREEFLTPRHLKFLKDARRENGMEYYSIHTPHSRPEHFMNTLEKTKDFARAADIPVIVVHSQFVDVFSRGVLDAMEKNMFVENGYEHNLTFLEKQFKNGVKICFDTAHFYVGSVSFGRDYYEDLDRLFGKNSKKVGHLHFGDVTSDFVGKKPPISSLNDYDVAVGDGDIDFLKAIPIMARRYKGVAVVEVDVKRQRRDMDKIQKILSLKARRTPARRISRRRPKR
ncbi:MAG: sugar phosphate isomerase/epimerase [Candidatus Aenigmarchaeota archaeon]|nr:sugar phosphate isomerase/epimerase [Candidatus Aenigmarchaeota archaeon]